MHICDYCESDCRSCSFGNPCLNCHDYDFLNDICKSDGGCAKWYALNSNNKSSGV